METAYREWEKRRRERGTGRHTSSRRNYGGKTLGTRERRRLIQLGICVALFLVVFIGKGIFPDKLADMREKLLTAIRVDTDFRAAFSDLGQSISTGEPVMDTLGNLWVDVFGGGTVTVSYTGHGKSQISAEELTYLTSEPGMAFYHLVGLTPPEKTAPVLGSSITMVANPRPKDVQPLKQSETSTVEHMDYSGLPMPDHATMDKYSLGLSDTTTPALGWVSSEFGWREHPVDGLEKFHNGVDLAVNDGTPVLAFADGVVDYIGDSPDVYGKYLQIRHTGGVTTFYAHCSKLLVQAGQTVKMGQAVAESGETGNATGPHLHFEIKLDGTLLNPLYYIKTA